MKGLILNDLLSIRRMLKTLAGIFLIFMVAWAVGGQPATGAMMLCIMGASYILNLFSYDEFYHWEKYLRVLPGQHKAGGAVALCYLWHHGICHRSDFVGLPAGAEYADAGNSERFIDDGDAECLFCRGDDSGGVPSGASKRDG